MIGTRKRSDATGSLDGGEGRGVRLGGSDKRPPTGYRNTDLIDDDEVISTSDDPLADYEDFADPGDSHPDDRRRDPLRR
ncbi:MAG TPA: hypothetical protein VFT12_12340 [Thermoanaerobaculia bacterium]|nr:hypothetical protein [Thermoanaerobaculia bacterium]